MKVCILFEYMYLNTERIHGNDVSTIQCKGVCSNNWYLMSIY